MTKKTVTNLPASIKVKLIQKAKERGIDPNEMWQRYAMERFLYRLGLSPYRDTYILKGALLFHIWSDEQHRSTRDMDFLGHGDPSVSHVESVIKEICQQSVPEPDGLDFDASSVHGNKIKEDQEYEGVRLNFKAKLGNITIPVQVDVGFGDAVTEDAKIIDFPIFLDLPAPQIKTYPKETVIAEKFQAMVALDMANSRLKDFYDVWRLSQMDDFDGEKLFQAIYGTFKRRQTPIPIDLPTAFTAKFVQAKEKQWQAFVKKHRLVSDLTLEKIIEGLTQFLMPVVIALRSYQPYEWHWRAAKTWEEPQRDEDMVISDFKQNLKAVNNKNEQK